MKQIVQDLNTGKTTIADVPSPQVRPGRILVRTHVSLVSMGTERMLVEFGKANLIEKARQQPERVRQVLDKIKSDGLLPTLETVFNKLGRPLPLGYCNAGEVIAVGEGVEGFKIGDRVVSNGPHAEIVLVPKNLAAVIPEDVSYEEASFTVIGSIALQGVRLVHPSFGETIVVIGLGLIGLLTTQFLLASGCQVIGFDHDEDKVRLASTFGVKAFAVASESGPVNTGHALTNGVGVDGVLITASTKSDEVISQAAQMSRKRGRIVLVGVIGLEIKRSDFYEKELTFQVSCSYGPGRYDDLYEQQGLDYPLPFVRWTENRNFQAVLNAIAKGSLSVSPLISARVKLEDCPKMYDDIVASKAIATLIEYPGKQVELSTKVRIIEKKFAPGSAALGIIGAGNFTSGVILPALKKLRANVKYIGSEKGLTSATLARKYRIPFATSDYNDILRDTEVSCVIISVRHNLHARIAIDSLHAGKHVFVEKPLALSFEDLNQIERAIRSSGKSLVVGFNRRFSPFAQRARELIGNQTDIHVIATMNAGHVPSTSWVHDMTVGGGRIVGEACHLIDLITFLTGSLVTEVSLAATGLQPKENTDNASLLLRYANGSLGAVNYLASGSKRYPKERIEVHSAGRTMVIDNFKRLECYGLKDSGFRKSQDKGHLSELRKFTQWMHDGGPPIISLEETLNTSRATLAALESLKQRSWIRV